MSGESDGLGCAGLVGLLYEVVVFVWEMRGSVAFRAGVVHMWSDVVDGRLVNWVLNGLSGLVGIELVFCIDVDDV